MTVSTATKHTNALIHAAPSVAVPGSGKDVGAGVFALLLAYAVVEFVRPQAFLNITASWFRPALFLSALLCIYWVKRWGLKELVNDRILLYFFLLVLMGALWIPFAFNNYWAFQATKGQGMYLASTAVPLALFLVSRKRRRQFFTFWMLILFYLAAFVIWNGGQGPGGILEDENDMAFALCMGLPYPFFLAQQRNATALRRACCYGLALLILLAIVWTHSRGGFVGLTCVALYIIYLSRHKIRNFAILGMLGLCALQFAPDTYMNRISTITDAEDYSRTSRLTSWLIAWQIFADNPVVGVGPRNYPWHSGDYHRALRDYEPGAPVLAGRAAHSVYFTLLPEYGVLGTVLFFVMIATIFRRLGRCERVLEPRSLAGDDEADADLLLARAHKASLIGFLSTGTFISVLYYPQLWYTVGFVVALSRSVETNYGFPQRLIRPAG